MYPLIIWMGNNDTKYDGIRIRDIYSDPIADRQARDDKLLLENYNTTVFRQLDAWYSGATHVHIEIVNHSQSFYKQDFELMPTCSTLVMVHFKHNAKHKTVKAFYDNAGRLLQFIQTR